jgi:hypothetical protein
MALAYGLVSELAPTWNRSVAVAAPAGGHALGVESGQPFLHGNFHHLPRFTTSGTMSTANATPSTISLGFSPLRRFLSYQTIA